MAKESMKAREIKRAKVVAKYAEKRKALKEAGLDSLPGAGAEILSDRVRRLISKGKCEIIVRF